MPGGKTATAKKGTVKKKLNKGQTMTCEVCGLSVIVDEIGDEVVETDSMLLCCGQPMKEKKEKAKTAK